MGNIEAYLNAEGKNQKLKNLCLAKMEDNPDIKASFEKWIDTRDFSCIDSPMIEGYDALRLSKETNLSPMGIFNYLVFLRKDPERAVTGLKKGLPTK